MGIDELITEPDCKVDSVLETVFGKKVALALIAVDWKYKEIAMKLVYK
jgi:hypothetical protein